ncbi:MAG TPA: CopD family protein [Burkholderiaceae bacterium]|nr:CopD family protein [Burkholderiaceae bacterium]
MGLLVDVFGFLSVVLRGLALTAQSFTVGGISFLFLLARPLAPALGAVSAGIVGRARRLLMWSSLALAGIELVTAALQVTVLAGTLSLSPVDAVQSSFALAALTIGLCAVVVAIEAGRAKGSAGSSLVAAAVVILVAQVASSHAAARVDGRLALGLAGLAHMAGAAVWIGGLPYLCSALALATDIRSAGLIARRYSALAIASVALLLAGAAVMAIDYIGTADALYGTSYGAMVAAKVLLLCGLLWLGAMNFRLGRRLGRDPSASALPLRRFAEVELGIGVTIIFAAASLTSQPPSVDLTADRASWSEVVEWVTPRLPRLTSPEHDALGISRLHAQILAAAAAREPVPRAFVPGEGVVPPRNAMDLAWSEFNHHWAGLFVLGIGLLALLERAKQGTWARHWPLVLVMLAIPMIVRADPEVWPMGQIGLLESLRDPEVIQHRLLESLTAAFGALEWRVRTGRTADTRAALIFPLLCALGGGLLLTHSHALANVKDQLLIEISHLQLAAAIVIAAWARWIELRLDGQHSLVAGWIWRLAFLASGVSLLFYREQ